LAGGPQFQQSLNRRFQEQFGDAKNNNDTIVFRAPQNASQTPVLIMTFGEAENHVFFIVFRESYFND
jgi:hypothetical protein